MSRLDESPLIPVRVGDCLCAGKPHDGADGHDDGDIVYLTPQLSLEGGLLANAAMASFDGAALEKELGLSYILGGVAEWNFLDDAGRPIPLTPETLRKALKWNSGGRVVAEEANRMYFGEVVAPLLERVQKLSAVGPTGNSPSRSQRRKAGTRRQRASSSSASSATTPSAA